MRRAFVGLMALLIVAALAGCESGSAQQLDSGIQVVATIFPPYDLARQIAGDGAEVHMLVKPGVESHAFEPTPADIMAIGDADVFVYIGGENEDWVDRVLASVDVTGKQIVRLIDFVDTLEEEEEEDEHDHGHEHGIDEHIWTAPENAVKMAAAIAGALAVADPDHADGYAAREAALKAELDELDASFRALVDGAVRRELVFGDRFPFRYFAEAYGLVCYAAFPSCANDSEPSARVVAELIDRVKEDGLPVVYTIEQSNGRVAQVIADATGATVARLHSAHNVTSAELEAGATLVSLMTDNLAALRAGLY